MNKKETIPVCTQCGKSLERDLIALFTEYHVCRACVDKNFKKATKK